jgi:hypothetical protein
MKSTVIQPNGNQLIIYMYVDVYLATTKGVSWSPDLVTKIPDNSSRDLLRLNSSFQSAPSSTTRQCMYI